MPSVAFVDNRRAIQYTGSNSAELDAEISNFTVVSEVAGVLTFDSSSPGFVANIGDWVTYTQGKDVAAVAAGCAHPGGGEGLGLPDTDVVARVVAVLAYFQNRGRSWDCRPCRR